MYEQIVAAVGREKGVAEMLDQYDSLHALATTPASELAKFVGKRGASRLKAAIEMADTVYTERMFGEAMSSPAAVYARIMTKYAGEPSEVAVVLSLDTKLRVIAEHVVGRGMVDRCNISPREVFIHPVRDGAARIIFAHTHPSGDPTPSANDIEFTHRLKKAGDLLGVPLVDHIVVGRDGYVSLAQQGRC